MPPATQNSGLASLQRGEREAGAGRDVHWSRTPAAADGGGKDGGGKDGGGS